MNVTWREMPNGHWLVCLWSGDRLIWADTVPRIYLIAEGESA